MKNVFVLAAALLVAACGPRGEDTAAPEAARVQSAAATITGRRPAAAHPRAGLRCVRGTRPGHARRGQHRRVPHGELNARPRAGEPDGYLRPARPSHRLHEPPPRRVEGWRSIPMRFPDDYVACRAGTRRNGSTTPRSSSSATASSRRSTAGTTTRASTCGARRSSCS